MSDKKNNPEKLPRSTVILIVIIIVTLVISGVSIGYWMMTKGPMAYPA